MILRPLELPAPASKGYLPAWEAVHAIQSQSYESCWMITQPSHAALAGELAANSVSPQFSVPDEQVLRAIALHDAGWGIPDAQAIMRSRSVQQHRPSSFLATTVAQFVEAWEKSIEVAQSVSPAGGYAVSRHFWRLAHHRVKSNSGDGKRERQRLESFQKSEEFRQKRLAAQQSLSLPQLEQLTDLLQFFDVLSLYICCGALQNVVFPEYSGIELRITRTGAAYKLDPSLINTGVTFKVAALRYPATKAESSREIEIKIE